jgi:hypothetical protein
MMKTKIFAFMFVLSLALLALSMSNTEAAPDTASVSAVNLNGGLVAHYEFEGNANDSSENGYHGIEHGGLSYTDGVIDQAASFDGIDDWINIGSNHPFANGLSTFTIAGWYKADNRLENFEYNGLLALVRSAGGTSCTQITFGGFFNQQESHCFFGVSDYRNPCWTGSYGHSGAKA